MKAPQQGPLGVQLLAHEDGAFLTVEEEAPFWMFWKVTRRCTVHLNKFGMIWLYQAVAKLMRNRVIEAGYDELVDDLRRSFTASEANIVGAESMDDRVQFVANLLRQKGWVKM